MQYGIRSVHSYSSIALNYLTDEWDSWMKSTYKLFDNVDNIIIEILNNVVKYEVTFNLITIIQQLKWRVKQVVLLMVSETSA